MLNKLLWKIIYFVMCKFTINSIKIFFVFFILAINNAKSNDDKTIESSKVNESANIFSSKKIEFAFSTSPLAGKLFEYSLQYLKNKEDIQDLNNIEDSINKYFSELKPGDNINVNTNFYFVVHDPINQYFSMGLKCGLGLDMPFFNQPLNKEAKIDTTKVERTEFFLNTALNQSPYYFQYIKLIDKELLPNSTRISTGYINPLESTQISAENKNKNKIKVAQKLKESLHIPSLVGASLLPSVNISFSIPFKFYYPLALGVVGEISPFLSLDCGIKIVSNNIAKLLNGAYRLSEDLYNIYNPLNALFNERFLYENDIIAYLQPSIGFEYYPTNYIGISFGYMLPTYNTSLNSAYKNSAQRTLSYLGLDTNNLKDDFYDWNFANYYGNFSLGLIILL